MNTGNSTVFGRFNDACHVNITTTGTIEAFNDFGLTIGKGLIFCFGMKDNNRFLLRSCVGFTVFYTHTHKKETDIQKEHVCTITKNWINTKRTLIFIILYLQTRYCTDHMPMLCAQTNKNNNNFTTSGKSGFRSHSASYLCCVVTSLSQIASHILTNTKEKVQIMLGGDLYIIHQVRKDATERKKKPEHLANIFKNLTCMPSALGSTPESKIAIVTPSPLYCGYLARKAATPVSTLGTRLAAGKFFSTTTSTILDDVVFAVVVVISRFVVPFGDDDDS